MGGTVLGVSSQHPSTLISDSWFTADTVQPVKDIVGYEHVLDADSSLCAELGCVIAKDDQIMTPAARTPEQKQSQYPHGMTQPGCFALSSSGETLYRWVLQPGQTNGMGAFTRAKPEDSWSIIKARLEGKEPSIREAAIDDQKPVMKLLADAKSKAKPGKAKL
eukprot:gnl/TRDRNA2_/TRDRNA2_198635_c0_seq1.p1 gnl/TRDRNA2_/TRDRNA2_198635_c0~~gnl/TRDRNA2_/TRDRNA2_198635_c0_seq1.p1  ORF type:complete len:163 (-),score=28.18 gnl/TRDRNA2_/TRDRNA2_198635_c0_seq1:292-780(-)